MTAQNKRHYNIGKTKEDHLKTAQDAGRDQPDFGDEVILGDSSDAPMAGVDPVMVSASVDEQVADSTVFDPELRDDLLRNVKTGAYLDSQVFPPLQIYVPGLIVQGYGVLIGPPKIGKSWLVLDFALALACGGKALGVVDVKKSPVLYLALEDGDRRMQSRCRTLLQGQAIPEGFQYATVCKPGLILPTIEAWLSCNPPDDPGVVFVDTLAKVMPRAVSGETAYERDYRVGASLKDIADRYEGSSVNVVHHTRKTESEDWMDGTSGTQGVNGAADYTVRLSRTRGQNDGVLRVTGRDTIDGDYSVLFDSGQWTLDGDTLAEAGQKAMQKNQEAGLGVDQQVILKYANDHPDGVTPTMVAEHLAATLDGWTPKSGQKAGTYLKRLADAGRLDKSGRGTYVPVSTLSTLSTLATEEDGDREILATVAPTGPVESVESVELPCHTHVLNSTVSMGSVESVESDPFQDAFDLYDDDMKGTTE